jgi:hypothetical protein
MRGESMAIEAHLAFDAETPASRRARLQATRVCRAAGVLRSCIHSPPGR